MSERLWRLEARRRNGECVMTATHHGPDSEHALRQQAAFMATVHGQKGWKFDLYEGGTLRATYKRGVWTEHGKEKATC